MTDNDQQKYYNLHNQYLTSVKRLSVYAYTGSNPAKNDNSSGSTPRTPEVGQTVELMPELSAEILDFARGYSENMRLKNECIDLYNTVKINVNTRLK